jgi:hypothetical protein
MEVHHHSHTSRKRWTHYFWEFLMLFLAVFCGFLAEYQLEHKIEKDRERQYMESIIEDLQIDTTKVSEVITLAQMQILLLDSLIEIANNQTLEGSNIERFYLWGANSTRAVNMNFETRTSTQLRNAGGMRLVRKKKVADSILNYWSLISTCENISIRLENSNIAKFDISVRLLHNKYYIRENKPIAPVAIRPGAQLINSDPALIAEFSNRSFSRRTILVNYIGKLTTAKQSASQLISQIRKDYRIKR